MNTSKNQPFSKRLRFALAGLAHGLSSERSLKAQVSTMLLVMIAMAFLHPAPLWWALVILASANVLAAELFNTSIGRLADHLHPDIHPEIRIVKDCAAASVLLTVAGAVGVAAALLVTLIERP